MDAVKFINELSRMCESETGCIGCPAKGVCHLIPRNIEQLVSIVEKWSKEHPQKTMLQDFLEKHPNAPLDDDGTPQACPDKLGYSKYGCSVVDKYCKKCWNRPLEE